MSEGEKKILKILKSCGCGQVVREFTFPTLKGKKGTFLRYDFAIVGATGVKFLIEFDGAQHFHQTKPFHKTLSDFKKCMERDRKKNNFAIAHRIPLYRIPYWEIEEINSLDDILRPAHKVTSQYHNDFLRRAINESK